MPLRIDFYHDAPSKLDIAARITHKAVASGNRVWVLAPDPATLDAFDRALWSFNPLSFVPHCRADDPLAVETPVLLSNQMPTSALPGGQDADLLLNLGATVPEGYPRFNRLIEIVGQDEADREPARTRYRQYRENGHDIESHRLGASS